MSEKELRRQIRIMKAMGLGGFFMHSRTGLDTAYLGEDWFACVRACLDEARRNGMHPWLYDEDRYPSGACGGAVTKNREFRQRSVDVKAYATPEDVKPLEGDDLLLAVFTAEVIDERNVRSVRRETAIPSAWEDGRSLLVFRRHIEGDNSWYNGQAYLDTMNPAAVKCFIEKTHDAYHREIGADFGTLVPGIFTDEPNYMENLFEQGTAWTDALPSLFREKYGYDLLDHLPELFYFVDGREFSRARLDYRNLCASLFCDAFARQIGEWCASHDIQMTGHVLWEDDVLLQTSSSGADMRFYQYMQMPGIDVLTEHWTNFVAAKQCTSVAHQFGRKWRLSETYGVTGWDFPFAGHKALCDWQYALGINFRCQHLAWYSMEGEAKRDYPASISYQSPWHRMYPMVEDYFARLGAALSEGEEQRRLLVVHPIESTFAWMPIVRSFPLPEWTKQESEYLVRLTNQIIGASIDFDFGDEELMVSFGGVENGRLKVKLASYSAVLIPRMRTIRSTTLRLLKEFAGAGGLVGFYGQPPQYVDGVESDEAAAAYQSFRALAPEQFSDVFSPSARLVSFTDRDGREIEPLMHIMREADDHLALFVCNFGAPFQDDQWTYPMVLKRNLEFPYAKVRVKARPGLKAYELDLLNGGFTCVPATYENGHYAIETSFAQLGSRLFILSSEEIAEAAPPAKPEGAEASRRPLDGPWDAMPDDFNVLVLDKARYSLNGGPESALLHFLQIDDEIRKEHLNVATRGWFMVQPWIAMDRKPDKVVDLALKYDFLCRDIPKDDCYLAVERPEYYDIHINGTPLEKEDCGFWVDLCLRRLKVPASMLRIGENTMTLSCKYHELLPGLESLFLLGDFGVMADGRTIAAPSRRLEIGDWTAQGYCNYTGNMLYRMSFIHKEIAARRFHLEFPSWAGVALEIRLNGGQPRRLPWPPYRIDVTEDLKDGVNMLEVKVVGHRRNAFGPFYLKTKTPDGVSPIELKTFEVEERQVIQCGLLEAPLLCESFQ
ncbi:MAG: hypothetical protein J5833_06635 [Victivallales bacterium]|nr:hypothetical protein [Victivallales bacterium]